MRRRLLCRLRALRGLDQVAFRCCQAPVQRVNCRGLAFPSVRHVTVQQIDVELSVFVAATLLFATLFHPCTQLLFVTPLLATSFYLRAQPSISQWY